MLNKERHQLFMGKILKDVYSDITISSLFGFKGGTSTFMFYNLPRFSVDLDFDLFSKKDQDLVLDRINKILENYGKVKEKYIKRNTVFFLLSYRDVEHNIKVEVNTRKIVENLKNNYAIKQLFGISMWVAKQDYLFAGKLVALTERTQIAMRDVYDTYFFAKNNWSINKEIIFSFTKKTVKNHLTECIKRIDKIKENQILSGLGELINKKEQEWIKKHLKKETSDLLKIYISGISHLQ